ncbi:hypothetical protein IWQ62_005055 [Dispira parvispora]|uniref:Uncharacterized protein n=1 Tax=Dispira parvispora TaxID=1520584 RepID=A0A9W8ARJ8_9FUNG|nr:hypothetical protein IWQ62_005055 [Dispira parvispora]
MRVTYCSHVALLVSLALVNVRCMTLPLEGDRYAPILHRRSEDSVYDDIVRDSGPLKELEKDLVMFAYSSKFENSNFYWDKFVSARNAFWYILRDMEDDDEEFQGVLEMIDKGDENQIRKLLADGTIFCKNSNGGYGQPLKSTSWNPNHRTQHESMWKELVEEESHNVIPFMDALVKRGLHKQRVNNPKEFLSPTHDDRVTDECYDVSYRDGQDIMLKWTIVREKNDKTDKVLTHYAGPMGRFNNFIMGSLYLAYLMKYDDKMGAIADTLKCPEVNDNMKRICKALYNEAKGLPQDDILSRTKTDIPEYFYSSNPSPDPNDVEKSSLNFVRNEIKLEELLEVL